MLEDESHVLLTCPCYTNARRECMAKLSVEHCQRLHNTQDDTLRTAVLLGSHVASDWSALGELTARVRQIRRRMRQSYARLSMKLDREAFHTKRQAWRAAGRMVCRHGIFFQCLQAPYCPCDSTAEHEVAWNHARFMPHLDEQLKAITTAPFRRGAVTRLGMLQRSMHNKGW